METADGSKAAIEKSGWLKTIIFGSLLAGVLDLAAAFINNNLRGVSLLSVMQSIASGLLGAASFTGGAATAALGVLLHFTIAFVWTIVFSAASRKIKFLTAQPVVSGVFYGVAVYILMYYAVVPLSAAPFKTGRTPGAVAVDVFIHIVCVGLPIALVNHRFSK